MKERSKLSVCRWVTAIMVLPCTICGLLGLLILPVFLLLLVPLLIPVSHAPLTWSALLSCEMVGHPLVVLVSVVFRHGTDPDDTCSILSVGVGTALLTTRLLRS